MELNLKLKYNDGGLISDPTLYRRLVGSLIYLTIIHPYISFVVQVVNQFVSQPRRPHLLALYRIIHYLKDTCDQGLFFPSTHLLFLKHILMLTIHVVPHPQAMAREGTQHIAEF